MFVWRFPMIVSSAAIVAGLVLLVWSSDLFVDGAAALARHFGVSPFIIGMVIIGFGTSLPEMLISVQSAIQGNPAVVLRVEVPGRFSIPSPSAAMRSEPASPTHPEFR